MKPAFLYKYLTLLLLTIITSLGALAQNKQTDSLAAIREYRSSQRYKDSISNARQEALDSIRQERIRIIDSIKAERKRILDSTVQSRQHIQDSIQKIRQKRSDSLQAIRKYKESKHYKDSVERIKQQKVDSIKAVRSQYLDSIKTERKRVLDSTLASREHILDSTKAERKRILDSTMSSRNHILDSVKAIQKKRSDSLAVIRKYRESRRYRDSVKVVRQSRLDSIKAVRKEIAEKLLAERKQKQEELKKTRQAQIDSLTAIRKQRIDSIQKMREKRLDSLAKQKELREKQQKAEQKRREDKLKMQLELKIQKKQDAWSNEKMLKKKWGFVRRNLQNTITRYNYYFNAKNKLHEAEMNMLRRNKDNYEKQIALFPFDPNKDSTVFSSDMDSIISKSSVGIQIHDPRTKWADDLYLLMGQAYYYKGDYNKADDVFKYIIGMENNLKKKKKKKKKDKNEGQFVKKEKTALGKLFNHRLAHNDAILWLTRSLTDNNKKSDAEAILDLLDATEKLSDRMKGRIALERANLHLSKKEYREAGKQLLYAAQSKSINKTIRQRASFLEGQLLYDMGLYDSAATVFTDNISLHPPLEMDFYARKYRAEAIAETGKDQSNSIASLKHLLKDAKYAPYHEQVYYILGKLSAQNDNYDQALAYYEKSLRQGKTTPKQKAITFASIGNIQYKTGQYNLAKRSFDSASYFAKNITDNDEINQAIRRSKSLDRIEQPYYTIQEQDSLLKLAAMSEKEQRAVARKYLKYLEKLKEDSAYNAQLAAQAGSLANGAPAGAPGTTASSWYFSSQSAVQQGYNEFKRKWGNRPLADNWRRASASTFGNDNKLIDVSNEESAENENGEITEESLLKAIPKTDVQIASAKQKEQRAYVDLAGVYIKDLDEHQEGLILLDTLQQKYPQHPHGAEVLYLRYTAALRKGQLEKADSIRTALTSKYPNAEFTKLIGSQTDTSSKDQNTEDIASFYESTYALALEGKYDQVLQRTDIAKRSYGDKNYGRKFQVLEALSLTATGAYTKADTIVKAYLKENPSDSLKPWLDAIQKQINELQKADSLSRASKDSSAGKIINDSLNTSVNTTAPLPVKNEYTFDSKSVHYCVFVFGKPEVREAAFKSGLTEFNKVRFAGLNLVSDLEILNAGQSIVVTKKFQSAGQAKIYLNSVKKEASLFRDYTNEKVDYFIISEGNFTILKKEQKLDNYQNFYKKNYK